MYFADSESNVFIAIALKTYCQILDTEYKNVQKMARGFFFKKNIVKHDKDTLNESWKMLLQRVMKVKLREG